jgi:methionine--tRNA ligase beta chain
MYTDQDTLMITEVNDLVGSVDDFIQQEADIQSALKSIFQVITTCNQYITTMEPWKLLKSANQQQRLHTVLYIMIESTRLIAVLLSPAMPDTAKLILDHMGVPHELREGQHSLVFGCLQPGTSFANEPSPILFTKQEVCSQELTTPLQASTPQSSKKVNNPPTNISVLDIRVGRIVTVKKSLQADTLYISEIDVGEAVPRQIVSGLVRYVSEDEMRGALVLVACNLSPACLRGSTSYGMVLAATESERVSLIRVPDGVSVGERVIFAGIADVMKEKKTVVPPVTTNKLSKLLKDFKTDSNGNVCWKGHICTVSSGACTSPFANAPVK